MRRGIPLVALLIFVLSLYSVCLGDDYIIGEGDMLSISVWGVDKLNFRERVRPDGKITVPALGEIKAAGYTPMQLQSILAEELKALVKHPVVTVIVEEINNNKVYVFGGGVRPGVYSLDRKTTLLQLLCQVGDLKDADLRGAYLLRGEKKIKEDFYRLFVEGDVSDDVEVRPNDLVFIPPKKERNVYVVGAVTTPRSVEYREGLTVMEAILEAGGFTKFAKQDSIVVLRKGNHTIPVDLKRLVKDGDTSQNIPLKPGDFVIVKEGIF